MENHIMRQPSKRINYSVKSPNSPLIKSPFVKIKIECKNLEKSFQNDINIFPISNNKFNQYSISLNPYVKISLNSTKQSTRSIFHNSPKWLEEFEFEILNNKTDKLIFEVISNSHIITELNKDKTFQKIKKESEIFLGFQVLPIKFLEKTNKSGKNNSIWLRLLPKRIEEYFVNDKKHVLNIDNHDPDNYKIDDNFVTNEKDSGVSLIKINFEYFNFYYLWLINCTVHTILQKIDSNNKTVCVYKLFIRRNDDLEWFKDTSFEEIEIFRNYLIKYISNVRDIPFPSRSLLSYIPIVNSFYYKEDNNDDLVEKKFILDNFFEQICSMQGVYQLEEFNKFFTENLIENN